MIGNVASNLIQVDLTFRPKAVDTFGSFMVWKKAGEFGLGDELMYWCPVNKCTGTHMMSFSLSAEEEERVSSDDISEWPADLLAKHDNWFESPVVCHKCGHRSSRSGLADSYFFKTSIPRIADKMSQIWEELNGNADVYMVRTKNHQALSQARELVKSKSFDKVAYNKLIEQGRDRDKVFYSRDNIIRDLAAGANLARSFEGFLHS